MGASASVSDNFHSTSALCMFVDEVLLKDELALKLDATLRNNYIEYIKGGAWVDSLDSFEDILGIAHSASETAWKRFGYKSPHCSDSPSTRSSFENSTRSSSTVDYVVEIPSTPSAAYQKMVLEDCYTAISNSNLFEKKELRPILLVALLPFFKQTFEEHAGPVFNSGDGSLVLNDKPFKRPKKDRLQALLLGAAAMFDSSELDAYLADPKVKWVDDYRQAILNLPVTVSVSTVDPAARESRIVYSNAVQTKFFGSSSNQVGENLHELFSSQCSPGGVEQIARAVFTARKYKRGILGANNQCQLRALKPVFDSHGKHALMLGVESRPFEDPTGSNKVVGLNALEDMDQTFQQVDDLLLLLPLLIRTV